MEQPNATNHNLADGFDRYEDIFFLTQPDQLVNRIRKGSIFTFFTENGVQLQLDFVTPSLLRFTYEQTQNEVASPLPYVLDPDFARPGLPELEEEDQLSHFCIRSATLICLIDKSDLRIKIYDRETKTLVNEDTRPFSSRSTIMKGKDQVAISKKTQRHEKYYGLGDKSCSLNLRGQCLENWNTDSFAYTRKTDPLYRSIPFYYGLNQGLAYGIFLHNTHRSFFDFDSTATGETTITAEGGTMDYFFIYGPNLNQIAQTYHLLTGVPELPPLWALGFHQCRWSYYPESRVHALAREFRDRKIPCDAIYLDIDYMDHYKCFTWNENYFPNPQQMIQRLKDQGFQTIVMIDPGIKAENGYWVYEDGLKRDVFCRRTSGELMIGPVWPENCVFPDFTNPATRQWWHTLYEELYVQQGISGFWNDMNEPAVFQVKSLTFPNEVSHHFEGNPTTHPQVHNIYGMQMSRATFEGLKQWKARKRPFVLTRATFSGGQRYAAIWTGDNIASWEHLRLASIQCQRASISGFSFVGSDVGGFAKTPDGELFVRWLQLGVFHPLYRVHSMGNHAGGAEIVDQEQVKASEMEERNDQEPWSFGDEFTDLARSAINLRYRLLSYLYSAFSQHVEDGVPLLRSLVFYDQHDEQCQDRENEFLFGHQMLANPILQRGARHQVTYLPAGDWYDFHSHQLHRGKQEIQQAVELDSIPLFVRAGSVIPLSPIRQHTGALPGAAPLLRVYYGSNESGAGYLYEDQGEGYAHLRGVFKKRFFTTEGRAGSCTVVQTVAGTWEVPYEKIQIQVIGLPFAPDVVRVDEQEIESLKQENGTLSFSLPQDFKKLEIR